MNFILIVIAVAIGVVGLLWVVSQLVDLKLGTRKRKSGGKGNLAHSKARWHAVKIKPGRVCCRDVDKYSESVYLANECPRLPLFGCTEKSCRCKYIHLDDRRSGGDRRIELGDLGAFLPRKISERRRGSVRRVKDFVI